jgi:flagellar hook protein FlgE
MSFNVALTGLNAVNEQLNTISNNIANAGTTGFKSSRTEFGSIYADSQSMGVEVVGTTQSISQNGSLVTTGRTLDLAIAGSGFYITRSLAGEVSYTRAGVFSANKDNFIVNANDQRLQGYPVDDNGNLLVGVMGDIQLQSANLPARATDSLEFVTNLDANEQEPTVVPFDPNDVNTYNATYTTKVYDSLGKEHSLTQYFVKTDTATNSWAAHYFSDGVDVTPGGVPQVVQFASDGSLAAPVGPITLGFPITGANPMSISLDYSRSSQYGSDFVVTSNRASGYAAGEQTGLSIEKDGMIYANYSNGQRMLQGQVALASFVNPEGLRAVDGTAWQETAESGQVLVGVPGRGAFGELVAGALENSNVDLTEQLVGLMEGQRNYQANTRVLTTNKELIQSLFNSI